MNEWVNNREFRVECMDNFTWNAGKLGNHGQKCPVGKIVVRTASSADPRPQWCCWAHAPRTKATGILLVVFQELGELPSSPCC
jgi:hypothetical protein